MEKEPLIPHRQDDQGRRNLGILNTSAYIIGTILGAGILAIPQAVVDCGVIGPVLLIACGVMSSYTGVLLGRCWTIIRSRYPEYEMQRITDPYPTIARTASGKVAEFATRLCVDLTMFGGAVVYLLLVASNISEFIFEVSGKQFSMCYVLLIVTAVLIPVSWLGTPKDFWQATVLATVTSLLAGLFIFISLIANMPGKPTHSSPELPKVVNAFGTILFAFGGASAFPTVQVDMKEPQKFPLAVMIAIPSILGVYLLVGVTGYAVLGDAVTSNIVDSLKAGWISYIVNIFISVHLLVGAGIGINPVNIEIEGFLGIPDRFTPGRVVVRTVLYLLVLFTALSVPHFDIILSLLGSTTMACTNFIFPPLYYYLLSNQRIPPPDYYGEDEDASFSSHLQSAKIWVQEDIPLHIKVLLFEIVLVGVVGGISSTYFSFATLITGGSKFTVPCYFNLTVAV